jgi:hypothetical protein
MSLKEVASGMKEEAGRQLISQRRLERGLVLTLRKKPAGGWSLSMTRHGVRPDAKEQAIVRNCFEVPKGSKGHNGQEGNYYLVRVEWGDKPAKEESEPGPEQLGLFA